MNEPVLRRPEPGRLFWRLLAWALVADIGFYSADAEPTVVNAVSALQEDTRSPFALWDEGVPFPTRESLAYPDGATDDLRPCADRKK